MTTGITETNADVSKQPVRTVLLVDDDVLIRMATSDYLRDCGLQVIEAANGLEAVTVLTSVDASIDLVFSDVQMPGMTGFELASWVHEHRPGLPIILASGDAGMAEKARDVCADGPMVERPYDFAVLFQRLQERLSRLIGSAAAIVGGVAAAPETPGPA